MSAPLHERLLPLAAFIAMETRDRRDQFGTWPAEEDAALIHEAAAALRPPEGDLEAAIAGLEWLQERIDASREAAHAHLSAALAHLRRRLRGG